MSIPAVPPTPATVQNVQGLQPVVDSGGWQAIGTMGANLSVPWGLVNTQYGQPTYEVFGVTYTQPECVSVGVPKIRLVHANYASTGNVSANTATGEAAPFSDIVASARIIDLVGATSKKVKWNGKNSVSLGQWGISVSDDIMYSPAAGTFFSVQTYGGFPTSTCFSVSGKNYASAGGASIYTNTGGSPGDYTTGQVTSPSIVASIGLAWYHSIVLGYTGTNPIKNFIIWADSNEVCLGDGGCLQGGWAARLGLGIYSTLSVTQAAQSSPPPYPFLNCSKQGESLVGFAIEQQHQMRLQLAKWFTNIICAMGANDIIAGTVTLAQMQAAALKLAGIASGLGKKFIMCTIPPILSAPATNGGVYNANLASVQTPSSSESIRTGFNSWLRDTSASGFLAQAVAAGCVAKYVDTFDAAAVVEVNASNVLTLNGGYFKTPANGATPAYSGTVTTGGAAGQLTDTGLGTTVNQYRGYTIQVTSGANVNAVASVSGQTSAGVISFVKNFGSSFTAGDTYALWGLGSSPAAIDDAHLTGPSQCAIAAAFPTSKLI